LVARWEGALLPRQYTPAADGQRFLVATVSSPEVTPIKVILNWKPPS
jgi:hypothetical protein